LVGCELDTDYYEAAMARIDRHRQQAEMFDIGELINEQKDKTLFE
jgi:hypothetical protein